LENEIKNVTSELASAFGNNQIAKATTSAFGQAIGSVLSGKKVSARTIANAAARVLTPVFDDVFRKSGAQIADELRGFGSLSDRNS